MILMLHDIAELIPTGAANAISSRDLANKCGCSEREIRHAVEDLRRNGVLICSSYRSNGGGYYRPRDSEEIDDYFKRQLSRIGNIWRALQPFKRYLHTLPLQGQLALDELTAKGGDSNGGKETTGTKHFV